MDDCIVCPLAPLTTLFKFAVNLPVVEPAVNDALRTCLDPGALYDQVTPLEKMSFKSYGFTQPFLTNQETDLGIMQAAPIR